MDYIKKDNILNTNVIGNHRNNIILLRILTIYFCLLQIINILRVTHIYNSLLINNIILIIISLLFLGSYIKFIKFYRLSISEYLLFIIPIVYFFLGLIINGFSRNLISNTYNSIIFMVVYTYVKHCDFSIYIDEYKQMAKMLLATLLSTLLIYSMLPRFGVKVISVAKTFFIFTFPLFFYIVKNRKYKSLLVFVLLILAGKRSIILSIVGLLFFITIFQRKISFRYKIILLIVSLLLSSLILYFSYCPSHIEKLPNNLRPLFYKTMLVNPFSEYSNIPNDARVLEAKSSIMPLLKNKIYLITGLGAGYTYDYYDADGVKIQDDRHNTHFSPISIYTKYGAIYLILLYRLYYLAIKKNFYILQDNRVSLVKKVMLLYLISSLINSFTEFTIYTDYFAIISLATLSTKRYNK